MRHYRDIVLVCVVLVMAASAATAQTPPTPSPADEPALVAPPDWALGDLACAPLMTTTPPNGDLRIIGSQDTVLKNMMGPGDTMVVSGGSNAGLAPGQRYFVRRLIRSFGAMKGPDPKNPLTVHTAAWIQILGVDTMLATATIVYACEGVLLDDYLEPFVAPLVPARTMSGNTPVYDNMGHIGTGVEGSQMAGLGQLMNINQGSNVGVVAGQRFLVFRDKRELQVPTRGRSEVFLKATLQLPLIEIGEVMVIAVRPDDATVQVLTQKDGIRTGDLIAAIR